MTAPSASSASSIRAWLVSHIAAKCALDPRSIDVRERFTRYGLDSLGATRLITELSSYLGRPLAPTLVWEQPTIEALASYLAGERTASGSTGAPAEGYDAEEPIAIVGMGCRFPGAADVASFWRLLRDGVDAVGEVPADRGWDEILLARGVDPAERAKVRRGAFLERIDGFDPLFFGISPREAASMDPQQRLMLELCWEALEDAGIRPGSLKGSLTGVFAGAIWSDYAALLYRGGAEGLGQYACTGVHHSIIANRISYLFGLEGPSLTLDSACSSGLVVVHLACDSLRRGESRVALAGAVNLNVLPESALAVSRFGALSPDGRCYTFDARANGYVRGEGGGVVVLKTLSRAIADGDPIHAVIRGSAVNNDGASNGLTAPSRAAQEAVLGAAYRRAGVRPDAVQYVEAHGTGTPLGDPIEARALGAVLGAGRPAEAPLLVGSAKTNVGHLEGAAGLVGLAKVALALEHRLLPPSLHFESPNPHAPLAELGLDVPTSARPWPAPEQPLTAGVSSFGLGGTNSHVVLEGWPASVAEVLPLAAESPTALRAQVEALRATLSADAGRTPLRAICADAASRCGEGASRIAVTARSHAELNRALATCLESLTGPDASRGVVFVFPGQGAQWHGMARALLQSEPVFRATLEACDQHIRRYLGWSLLDELTAPREASRLDHIEVSLPAIISIDIAVSAWWRSLGVEPAAVVGHSTGEIAAAHVAGALDLDDTMRIICAYGRFVGRFAGQGGMAFLGLSWDDAAGALAGFEGRVFRAIQDSAEGTVVAGEPGALAELLEALKARGVFCRPVSMNVPPHSPLVDAVRGELFEELRGIRPRRGSVPLISEVTGAAIDGEALDAAHWVRNFGDPAFFSGAVDALIQRGHRVFLDVGPHPLTRHSIQANLRRAGADGVVLSSLRRDEDGRAALLETLALLHTRGVQVRWEEIYPTGNDAVTAGAEAWLLPLSARSPEALTALASAHAEAVRPGASPTRLRDLVYTASVRREHHAHRLAVVGRSREELSAQLAAFARGEAASGAAHGQTSPSGPPKIVFVFPGQGSQWVGMGRTLLAEEPAFRAALEACDEAIAREAGFSVIEELRAGEDRSRLSEIAVVQPVLFAIEVALAALWRSWGVTPDAVVGHSMGEVAAAHVAGILSLADAARVICRRSRLLRQVSGRGAMGLVELTLSEAEAALAGYADRLSVAVSNGPRSTVISGDPAALEEVLSALEARGVFCRRVKVDVASHSPQMDPLLEELRSLLSEVRPGPAQIAMRSTVTGADVAGPELDAAYWARNLRAPVLFSGAIQRLVADGRAIFLELSPHPILLPAVEENLRALDQEGAAIASVRRGSDERRAMLESLGKLWARGLEVDFRALHPAGGRVASLPTYPWQRERYWLDAPARDAAPRSPRAIAGAHPLLGAPFASMLQPEARVWELQASVEASPWLSDHRLRGEVIFPGGGYVELALAAGTATYGAGAFELADVRFERMLALPCGALQLAVVREPARATVTIASRAEGAEAWTRHASAELRFAPKAAARGETPAQIQGRCPRLVEAAEHYARVERVGVEYGPGLRSVERIWVGDGEAVGLVRLPPELAGQADAYQVHPALLDGSLQILMGLVLSRAATRPLAPVGLSSARLHARLPEQIWVHARGDARSPDLRILDEDGRVLLEIDALRLAPLDGVADPFEDCVHAVAWRRRDLPAAEVSAPAPTAERAPWLILRDARGTGAALASALRARGETCVELDAEQLAELPHLLPEACRGVVHCGSLDAAPWEQTTPATLEADLRRGSLAAVLIAQAILRRGFRDPPRLLLVTRGAQPVGAGPVSAAQAPLWGLSRVIALEHPELECTRIDLPATPRPDDAERLASELLAGDGEEQIALRPEGRFAARLVRSSLDAPDADPSPARPVSLAPDGTYLITGGLGGLGIELARCMVAQGARHLALVGRSAPGEAASTAIRAMEEAGAEVRVLRGDVSRAADVERIVGEIAEELPPLRGVVHAAVVVADRTLLELGEEHLAATMRPKILGAWNLHAATRGLPLDFFVMYSSLASLLGEPGQAAYAAGNAFLDALAHARAAEGLPATSIQWGLFADVGVAAPGDRSSRLASRGLESFTIEEGTALFARVLARPRAEVGLFRISLRRWLESTPQASGMRYLSELPREPARPQGAEAQRLREALASAPPAERAALLEKHVIEQLGQVLRIAPSRIDPRASFTSFGLDSLTSLEARNRLEKSLGLKLQATLFFTYPQASSLVEHLLTRLDLPATKGSGAARPPSRERDQTAADRPPLDAAARGQDEPLAVVGVACRFPGGGDGPEAYWQMLERGVDAVREIPAERWPREAIPGDRPEARWAALLDGIDGFDAAFFGVAPREAESLDPQQRLLLEVVWEALEDAGQPPDALAGTGVGVFVGLSALDYQHRLLLRGAEHADAYTATGNLLSTAAGRISYSFGFQGPCVSVDTACSSSLVSVALACQSLRAGDCDVALAGGVMLLLSPYTMASLAGTQALSPDGRCKTLDARANGFARGEGCGMVVLKRLSDARRDGDRVLALIRGWAVNQDGRSTGLTAPNVLAQQALIRKALERARVSSDEIGYVEMHGTGTPLGDPIEADALREVMGKPRADGSTCVLGAVKTNLGHLEGAAGVAGLIKTVLALENEAVPPNLHFRQLNPRIALDGTPFVIPTEPVPWRRNGKRRVAGVSSFGISGTNAHVVLEEAPAAEPAPAAPERSAELLVLSAKSAAALTAQAARLRDHLEARPELGLGDVAFSLATTRGHLEHRLAVAATSREAALGALSAAAEGQTPPGAARGRLSDGSATKVVFVFPGQGSQWVGMGQKLLADEPVFRAALEACDRAIQAEAGWSLLAELAAGEAASQLGRIDVVQPALFAMEVALSALWRSWGVEPDAVVGHSMGEVAAAHVAGALSLEDAAAIICRRSRLLRRISGRGEMAVVELSLAEAEAALRGHEDRLSVAVSNSPRSTVVAGEPGALAEVLSTLEAKGVFCRRVKVDVASHSPQVDPLRDDLLAELATIHPRSTAVPMRSTVTGATVAGPELVAGYWADNLRQPVRFAEAVRALLDGGHTVFVEMSPHPILVPAIEENQRAASQGGVAVGSLRRGQDERAALLEALGALWSRGQAVAWERLFAGGGRRAPLPTYAWQRERYWIDAPAGDAQRSRGRIHAGGHPLLGEGQTVSTQAGLRLWETTLDLERLPWLRDHRVHGMVVLPGAAYLEMALAAGAEALADSNHHPVVVSDVAFVEAMAFASKEGVDVQVVTTEERPGQLRFQIASRAPSAARAAWTAHARGALRRAEDAGAPVKLDVAGLRARLGQVEPAAAAYAALSAMGLEYGPAFQGIAELWRGDGEALGRVRLPEASGDALPYHAHPALLDACFQVMAAALRESEKRSWMPVEAGMLRLWKRPQGALWCHARLAPSGHQAPGATAPRRRSADLVVVDAAGAPVAEVSGLVVQELASGARRREEDDWFLELAWEPAAALAARVNEGRFLLLGEGGGLGAELRAALEALGHAVVHAVAGAPGEVPAGCWPVDDTSLAGVRTLLGDAFGEQAPTAVVHLRSLEGGGALDAAAIEAALARGCDSALCTVQALAGMGYRDAPRLWLVTRGAQAAGAGEIAPAQAPLLGLGRVIALEHPELRCARLDLDPARPEREIPAIVAELLGNDAEHEVALRGGERRVARLVRRPPEGGRAEPGVTVRRDGSYLVTGGLGGLGLSVAGWLVRQGAGHLVLMGRSGAASREQQAAVAALEAQGARVTVVKADVAERAQVEQALREVTASGMPLRGVVHAAGLLDDGLLLQQSPARLRKVMAPKVAGALHLHALTREAPLDFFVLYASGAGLLGSPGQGNYAAANTFLDALAHQRRAQGLPALSVDWGAFSEVGLAAAQDSRGARLTSRGMRSLTPEEGLSALARLLDDGRAQVGVLPIDVRQWVAFYPALASSPMLSRLIEDQAAGAGAPAGEGELVERLALATPGERASLLLEFLRAEVSRVLRIPGAKLDVAAPLTSLGMDSLMGLELRNRIEAALGTRMPATLLWTFPTVTALSRHLGSTVGEVAVSASAPEPARGEPQPAAWASELDDLSEDALMDALRSEL